MNKHEAWLKKHIRFDPGLPSLSTIKRVIGMINPTELEETLSSSLKKYLYTNKNYYADKDIIVKEVKAMDGKTANSSGREKTEEKISKTNAMSLLSTVEDICEITEFIEEKTTSKLSMNSIRFNISMDFENEIDNII